MDAAVAAVLAKLDGMDSIFSLYFTTLFGRSLVKHHNTWWLKMRQSCTAYAGRHTNRKPEARVAEEEE